MNRTDRQKRADEAMGEAMYQMVKSMPKEEREKEDPFAPMKAFHDKIEKRADELGTLSKDESVLLKELCSFFDSDRKKGDEIKQVFRARAIVEELQMNVNFPVLPYGETLLSGSINHSLEMMQMLIEKGADVNMENEMMSECAIDQILEEEEMNDGLSDEKKAMKKLLLSKGANTAEERFLEIAELARKKREESSDDDDDSEIEEEEEEDEE
ncbi:hypothetical protein ACHAXR_004314 [Thalassiosira sp. AJA248-18]